MFYKSCRGCPAVTYGYTQNPLSDNPLCFRELLNKKVETKEWNSPQLNTTKEQEAEIVRSMLHNQYSSDYSSFIENEEVLILIGTLISSKSERKKFFANPDEYIRIYNPGALSKKEIAYICYYVECVMQNRIPNPMRYALDM